MLKNIAPADHIPFVSSEADCQILTTNYADACVVRLPLLNAQRLIARIQIGRASCRERV